MADRGGTSSAGGKIAPGRFPWTPKARYTHALTQNPGSDGANAATNSAASEGALASVQADLMREIFRLQKELEQWRDREVANATLKTENAHLKRELGQCRKREAAVQEVFVKNFEKEQELSSRRIEIDKKEVEQQAEAERLRVKTNDLEERERDLTASSCVKEESAKNVDTQDFEADRPGEQEVKDELPSFRQKFRESFAMSAPRILGLKDLWDYLGWFNAETRGMSSN